MSASGVTRVISEPLGGSALSLAIQTRRLPASLQPWSPITTDDWREHARTVRQSLSASWYLTLKDAFGAEEGEAGARLRRVAAEGGVVVTTGQQAALFGGPLYTIAKALTALALADRLEQELGLPVAPVFWAATDDADFLEASITYVADAQGLHELRHDRQPPAGTTMADAELGDIQPLLDELRRACGSAAHGEYFDLTAHAFASKLTLGSAYVQMLRSLLGPLGISVFDSSSPAYRAAARPVLHDALARAPQIADEVARRSSALRDAGFEPQVEDDRGLSLVAVIEQGIKRRVPLDEATRIADAAELAPNVLLRPVVERAILPTVAYVGGPAELAYFAQSRAVAEALSMPAPVAVPRWSCTVIEPFVARALTRLEVSFTDLRDRASLERRLAESAMPAGVAAAWAKLQEQLRAALGDLAHAVNDASLMPPAVVQGLENSLLHKLTRGERRILAAVKRREENVRRDLDVASASLFPLGQRQERVLNYVPMLTRGGAELLAEMQRAAGEHARTLVGADRPQPAAAR